MDCERTQDLLIDYLYGELSPVEREVFEHHLAECPACAQEAQALSGVLDLVRAQPLEEPSAKVNQRILHAARTAVAHRQEQARPARRGLWAWLAHPAALSAAAAAMLLVMVTIGLTAFEEDHPEAMETAGAPIEAIQPAQAQKDLKRSVGADRLALAEEKVEEQAEEKEDPKKEKGQLSALQTDASKPAETPAGGTLDIAPAADKQDEGGAEKVRRPRKARKKARAEAVGRGLSGKRSDWNGMDQLGSASRAGDGTGRSAGALRPGQVTGGVAGLAKADRPRGESELLSLGERGKAKPKTAPPSARPSKPKPGKQPVAKAVVRGPTPDSLAEPAPAPADKPAPDRRLFAQPPPVTAGNGSAGEAAAELEEAVTGGAARDRDTARFAKQPAYDESTKDAKVASKAKKSKDTEWVQVEEKRTAATRAQKKEDLVARTESDDAAQPSVETTSTPVASTGRPSDSDKSGGRFSQAERALADHDYAAAAAGYQTYLKAQPHGPRAADARFGYARALFLAGRCDRAEGAIKTAVARHPKHRLAADALFDLASCHVRKGRFGLAVQVYDRIGRDFPARQSEARRERARIAPDSPAASPAEQR